jgi:hypothetical protein
MDARLQLMTLDQLRATQMAGGVAEVVLRAEGGAFFVSVTTLSGGDGVLVKTRDRTPRGFTDPRKALALLHGLGITTARLDTGSWTPDAPTVGKPRPDRSEALKRAQDAAAHDAWFRAEVEQALREADDPNTVFIPHEEVMARWEIKRAELLKRAAEQNK